MSLSASRILPVAGLLSHIIHRNLIQAILTAMTFRVENENRFQSLLINGIGSLSIPLLCAIDRKGTNFYLMLGCCKPLLTVFSPLDVPDDSSQRVLFRKTCPRCTRSVEPVPCLLVWPTLDQPIGGRQFKSHSFYRIGRVSVIDPRRDPTYFT
ncbi:hypothetical protein M413DRAFT_139306 [Hebeloma cylindrosporum]|uniref:Uncharacterized protein n=1 Tax=Hebeloma cylindrosporum TaxID=76867 RepID=A0A0C3CC78_HEBCY|nr:hypothetical protein M413DRAFT_139306 [Hebeloma cylindrosporum h7]